MRRTLIAIAVLLIGIFLFRDVVIAAEPSAFSRFLGVGYPDTRLLVIRILQIIWFFAFAASLGFLIYGYVLYRRADPEDLYEQPHAKRLMFYGGIAAGVSLMLFIILTIAYIVIERNYYPQAPPPGQEQVRGFGGPVSLLETTVRDHYPVRDERNVPRDTAILITFASPIKKESVLDSTNGVRRDSILIRRTTPTASGDFGVVAATGVLSVDGTTLKLLPTALIGEPDQKIYYTVALTSSILKHTGEPFFSGGQGGGYSWQFEVSGLSDNTPPTVESYLPLSNSHNPINSLIQVTFSEPVDPFTANPDTIIVLAGLQEGASSPLAGTVSVGNGYRTITFRSQAQCGSNQCGSAVFCLLQNAHISSRIKAAAMAQRSGGRTGKNKAAFPYNGIVDLAGNSLDGGGLNGQGRNGISNGSDADDFLWKFSTGSQKETAAPRVISIQPQRDSQGVSLTAPVTAVFSKFMDITALNNATIGFSRGMYSWVASNHIYSERRTRTQIHHEPFAPNEIYTPVVRSGVTDLYQNCYNPCMGPGTELPYSTQQ